MFGAPPFPFTTAVTASSAFNYLQGLTQPALVLCFCYHRNMLELDDVDPDSEESVLTDEALERLVSAAEPGCFLCDLDKLQRSDSEDE